MQEKSIILAINLGLDLILSIYLPNSEPYCASVYSASRLFFQYLWFGLEK